MRNKDYPSFPNRDAYIEILFGFVLTATSVAVFFLVYIQRYSSATRFAVRGNYLLVAIYTFLLVMFLHLYGAYRIRNSRTRELAVSYALASIIENVLVYVVISLIARRMLLIWGFVYIFVLQCAVSMLLYIMSRVLLPLVSPVIPTLYIYPAGDERWDIASKFDKRRTSYSVTGRAKEDMPRRELLQTIDDYSAVILGAVSAEVRQVVIGYCYRSGKKVLLVPDMTDLMVGSALPLVMQDYLLYDLNTQGQSYLYNTAKRAGDILASGLGLLISGPIMILVGLAVKLQDGGPVFYRQTRLTKGGREFQLTKFRSMIVNAENHTGAVLAGKHDSRITPVGRFIRATRLDELPQLWNVFVGDMTLVGPRPERPEFYEKICEEYPEFNYRLMVKAGLTGYAQLYGKYNTTFIDKARMDMYYIQHATILWDLELVLYTLKIIFILESTEGTEESVSEKKEEDTVSP